MSDPTKFKVIESAHPYVKKSVSESVRFPGAKNIAILFDPKSVLHEDDYIEFLKGKNTHDSWPETDAEEGVRFGGKASILPGLDRTELLSIPAEQFEFSFTCDDDESNGSHWGWRLIAFDLDILDAEVEKEDEADLKPRKRPEDLFLFLENRSMSVQTVKIDMPVIEGEAYFEVIISTPSTKSSSSQIGCCVNRDAGPIEQMQHISTQKLPVCLGLGSVKGSYALDGILDSNSTSIRYSQTADAQRPFSKVEYSNGTVIGVLMDVANGKLYYHVDGVNKGVTFVQEKGLSWYLKGGLCPAISMCPGQVVTVNVGQRPFHGEASKYGSNSVLKRYSRVALGDTLVWNYRNETWDKSSRGSIVMEDGRSQSVSSYSLLVATQLQSLYQMGKKINIPEPLKAVISPELNQERLENLRVMNAAEQAKLAVADEADSVIVVETWSTSLSCKGAIDFSVGNTTACGNGGGNFNFPMAIAQFLASRSALNVTIQTESGFDDFSFGIARHPWSDIHDALFGEEPGSWGLVVGPDNKYVRIIFEGIEVDRVPSLKEGDTLCIAADSEHGSAVLSINEGEYLRKFTISGSRTYIAGATLSSDHELVISDEISDFISSALGDEDGVDDAYISNSSGSDVVTRRVVEGTKLFLSIIADKRLSSMHMHYKEEEEVKDFDETDVGQVIMTGFNDFTNQIETLNTQIVQLGEGVVKADLDLIFEKKVKKEFRPWLRRPDYPLSLSLSQRLCDLDLAEVIDEERVAMSWEFTLRTALGSTDEEVDDSDSDSDSDDEEFFDDAANAIALTGALFGGTSKVTPGEEDTVSATVGGDKNQRVDIMASAQSSEMPLEAIIGAASKTEMVARSPTFVKLTAHFLLSLARSVPKKRFSTGKKRRMALRKKKTGEDFEDDYDTEEDIQTLAVILRALRQLGAVKFCAHLLKQISKPDLQDSGIELANFLLLNALRFRDTSNNAPGMQTFLIQALQAQEDEAVKKGGKTGGLALGARIKQICVELPSLRGEEKMQMLKSLENICQFTQRLCDGQFSKSQDFFRKISVRDMALKTEHNLVECVLQALEMLRVDVDLQMSIGGTADHVMLFSLSAADTALSALVDMCQGPNFDNQKVLLEAHVGQVIRDWLILISPLMWDILERMSPKLPPLKQFVSIREWIAEFYGSKKRYNTLVDSLCWRSMDMLTQVEESVLNLLFTVMDDNPSAIPTMLMEIPPNILVEQFKLNWAGILFRPISHTPLYLRGDYDIDPEEDNSKDMVVKLGDKPGDKKKQKRKRKTAFKHLYDAFFVQEESSFRLDKLKFEKSKKELIMRYWGVKGVIDADHQIELTFQYYQLLEIMCSYDPQSSGKIIDPDEEFKLSFVDEEVNAEEAVVKISVVEEKLAKYLQAWRSRDPTSLISEEEAHAFPTYFASVEVVLKNQLMRIYFPIPRECRSQMGNPLVTQQMEQVIDAINRDTPESKLDSLLDLSIEVQNVIKQQARLQNYFFVRMLHLLFIGYKSTWILGTLIVTLWINGILLRFGEAKYGIDGLYDAPENVTYYNATSMQNMTRLETQFNAGKFFLPIEYYDSLQHVTTAHVCLSIIMLLSYLFGSATVVVNKGLGWRQAITDGLVSLPYSGIQELLYRLADEIVPTPLWGLGFLAMDPRTIYFVTFVVFSFLGKFRSIAFFAFHVIDIVGQIKAMTYVVKSVTGNFIQVLVTLLLALLIIWCYLVFGTFYFNFGTYHFMETEGIYGEEEGPITMTERFWQHLDFGLHDPPEFTTYSTDSALKHTFAMSYQIIVVVIMVAIITGIIINTFQELSTESQAIDDDIANICIICSHSRQIFERHRLKFSDHIMKDHNIWNYLYYRMYLFARNPTDLTGRERDLVARFKKQDLAYFPIYKAMGLPDDAKGKNDLLEKLARKIGSVERGNMKQFQSLSDKLDKLILPLQTEEKVENRDGQVMKPNTVEMIKPTGKEGENMINK